MEHDAGTARTYEFGAAENAVIGKTGQWVGYFAWIMMISGGLMGVFGLLTLPIGIGNLAVGAVYVLVGMWFRDASRAMHNVVTTSGNDVEHLMMGLDKMASAFKVAVILSLVGIVVAAIGVAIAVAFAGAMWMGSGGG